MLDAHERPPTIEERALLDEWRRPMRMGCVVNLGIICLLTMTIGIIGTPILTHRSRLDPGTAGSILMIGSLVLLSLLCAIPAVRRLPMRIFFLMVPPPVVEEFVDYTFVADIAWAYDGGDDDAPAVLLRVAPDRYVAVNDQWLEQVMDPDEMTIRSHVRLTWVEELSLILALSGEGAILDVSQDLPQPADPYSEPDALTHIPVFAVLREEELPGPVRDAVRAEPPPPP